MWLGFKNAKKSQKCEINTVSDNEFRDQIYFTMGEYNPP